jgi:hypothetical protein
MVLLACMIAVVAAAVLWAASTPITRRIKGWQARRLAGEANVLIEKEQWTEAAKKTRDAFDLRAAEPDTWHAIARLLTRTGQGSEAVKWWQRVVQAGPISTSDRRDYAAAAVSANELSLASEQVDLLLAQKSGAAPADFLLAAQLATQRGNSSSAVRYAERVLENSKAASPEIFGAAVLVFLNTPPQSPSYGNALDRLIDLAQNGKDTASLSALKLLGARPRRPRMTDAAPAPLSLVSDANHQRFISRSEIADRIENHPNARPGDRLLAIDIRAQEKPGRAEEYTSQAIESFRHGDDEMLAALGAWLYERGRFETMLELLPPDRAARRQELFLERIDALNALGRFSELADMLSSENPTLDPMLQHVFLAIVRPKTGEAVAGTNEWERAVQSANTTQKFVVLAQYAETNGAPQIADAAYAEVLLKQPHLRLAYAARLRLAETTGQTAKAGEIAAKMAQLWPEDTSSQMLEIYLRLLLGASGAEIKAAENDAGACLEQNPGQLGARMALALARLKLGRQSAALKAVSEFKPGEPLVAPPMAVRAAALAANGWNDQAREEAQKLATAKLLPEERALIAPLVNKRQ